MTSCASAMQTTTLMALLGNNFPCPWDDLFWWSGSLSSQSKLYSHEAAAWFLVTFFSTKKKKTTSTWNIFLNKKHRGIVHMTPSLCRDTHGLYPYEPVKQINRSESVGETFGAEALCPDPAASGRGKNEGIWCPDCPLELQCTGWAAGACLPIYYHPAPAFQDYSKMHRKAQKLAAIQIFHSKSHSWPEIKQ